MQIIPVISTINIERLSHGLVYLLAMNKVKQVLKKRETKQHLFSGVAEITPVCSDIFIGLSKACMAVRLNQAVLKFNGA
jgi:hypothetical protein